ncbi:two-component regulator propeller domain-containing protein [Kriegella aquimaris]|uniref:histidine kinase n=1 Tax=Kriegella aquimaris TaxID=192904 RepID=A0A1G9QTM0_9FLAO|nr:two-component regulator propeller domain-containing protein [Kriegella aquimaris]SDM14368.1 ligand-binding sensor domain-containing protein [Kriegella aquimaris]
MKKKKIVVNFSKIVGLVLIFVGNCHLFSQSQITFRQLSIKDGLSQNSAISVSQDSIGYLWIATQDGLNRYDGRSFTTFPYTFVDITKPDYSNLGKVYTDRQGGVWIIPMDRTLRKFEPTAEIFESLPGINDASTLIQGDKLNYWVGTYNNGLFRVKPDLKGGSEYKVEQVLSSDQLNTTIFNIVQHTDGKLLLTTEKKIILFDPATFKSEYIEPTTLYGEPIDVNFSDIVLDKMGREWIGTYGDGLYFGEIGGNGLRRISDLDFTDPLPQNLNIIDLYIDSRDRLWVATYGRGLYMINFEQEKIQHFSSEKHNPQALHYDDILCIYEDYSGTLWYGTDGAGLSYYDEYLEKFNSFTNYQTPERISIDVVRAITLDKDDNVWVGTSGKGLTQYQPETNSWQTFIAEAGDTNTISSNRIMALQTDTDGNLLIGTQGGGLNILDNDGQFTQFSPTSNPSLSANTIWTIYKDRKNRYWLGTREQGLVQFNKEKGEILSYKYDSGLSSNNIRAITEDDSGNLWMATDADGIVHLDLQTGKFMHYVNDPKKNSLSNNSLKTLYFAPNGILWIGTNGSGLDAFDTKSQKFYNYNIQDGLANNVIYAILPDSHGSLWLSSNKGITRFTPGDNWQSQPQITNYTNYDGLATEFNTGAYYKHKNGALYFGGLEGFYWFKPNQIRENNILPKTTITGLDILNQPYPLQKNRELRHDQNTLSFSFSSMQYSLPEKNQYQYKLQNYDNEWVSSGNTNFARYTQLPPGDYEFLVKSSNYDGVWNESPASYSFSIAPPWYLSSWAKIVYSVLFMALIFGVYRYVIWRWKVKLDLERKEEETQRLKKLNDFKSKLYTDISHEFRTPLTLISAPVDKKMAEGKLSHNDFVSFSMIKRNTQRLIALVDQLLHLAKLEKGELKLRIDKGNLGLFLGMITTSFEYKAQERNITYTITIENLDVAWFDEDALEKIVTNLLSNAFKYGSQGGECHFKAIRSEDNILISVKNTVEKHSDIDVDKLFTRFYQQDAHADGAGIGLSMVKELVHLYHGQTSVAMEREDLIHFQIRLPIEKGAFGKEEFCKTTSEIPDRVSNTALVSGESLQVGQKEGVRPILLIVEDQKEVREFLKSVWHTKYEVYEAYNGQKGVEKALEIVPDLIISDVRMPICDGIELCNRLKTDERTSHIPIILLTAGISEENELRGLRSGADDFITKPFKLSILETRVANFIATRKRLRSRYSQELVLEAKDIAITPTDEIFLNRVQRILDEHLSDASFNAAAFGERIGMSRMQLHRKLQAYTGLSTTEFIRSQRLRQAAQILKTTDITINEVAYTVGFNTPSYFIKCFKETYKKTPSEYLQSPN